MSPLKVARGFPEVAQGFSPVTSLERWLRLLAVTVAVAAWIDPAFTARGKPRVAVITDDRTALGLARDVQTALARRFDVTTVPDPAAQAWVAVSPRPGRSHEDWPLGTIVNAVVPSETRSVVIERVSRPATIHQASRAIITATIHARGVHRTSSTIALRHGPLELGRQTIRWSQPDERAHVRFDPLLPESGPNHLTIDVLDSPGAPERADLVIVSSDERVRVRVFEPRPSWTTMFIRRALERDARFEVDAVTRVSTGITSGSAADDFARVGLERYAVLIVGGADGLSAAEVERIGHFGRARGGSVVVALDRAPSGPVLTILPSARFEEKAFDTLAVLATSRRDTIAAREWVLAQDVRQGATTIPVLTGSSTLGAGLVRLPLGAGQVVLVGALDAWRFREEDNRRFDRAWANLVAQLAAEVPSSLTVRLDRDIVSPGEPVVAHADLIEPHAEVHVRASLDSASGRSGSPLRFWPEGGRQRFTARLNAPSDEGVYAVSVVAATGASASVVRVPLVVAAGARTPEAAGGALEAIVESRGGVVVQSGALGELSGHLERQLAGRETPGVWHPMRTPWWLVIFTASLGGEWWLRRRAGRR